MKPSELPEDGWIKVTFEQHPDCHLDGKPDPNCSTPSGSIIFDVDYSQLRVNACDQDAEPGSEGIPLPISPIGCSEETHRQHADEFIERLKLYGEQVKITHS